MSQVKGVIFDMDGLMFDTENIYYQANQQTADRLGLPFDYTFYEQYIGANEKEFFNAMYEANDKKELVDQFVDQSQEDVYNTLLNKELAKKNGLIDLLTYLKEQGIPMVVASSSERWLVDRLIARADINDYFTDVVGGDEVEEGKPSPDIFIKAWKKLGTTKDETLVLEDSLNGVKASYRAEIPVIMVPDLFAPNDEAKEKVRSIEDNLNEVKEWIKENNKK